MDKTICTWNLTTLRSSDIKIKKRINKVGQDNRYKGFGHENKKRIENHENRRFYKQRYGNSYFMTLI